MAKVLIFANDHATLYNFRRELIEALVSRGDEVIIALPRDSRNSVFAEMGCSVAHIRLSRFGKNPLRELATLAATVMLLHRVRPDVLLTYTAKPNAYGGIASRIHVTPHIATVTGLGSAFQGHGIARKASTLLQRFAYRKSKIVFFQNSENLAEFSALGILSGASEVIPGSGVNLVRNKVEEYPALENGFRVVAVARIRRDKGFDELAEVIRRLGEAGEDVTFDIVGAYEDTAYDAVMQQLQARYQVILHGSIPQEEVHAVIADSHCLVHPSHHEGMANVVLEAAATGRPVVVSDIAGCREAVEEGLSGLLVEPGNADSLESGLRNMIALSHAERRQMGLVARRKIEKEFDRDIVVRSYIRVIDMAANAEEDPVYK